MTIQTIILPSGANASIPANITDEDEVIEFLIDKLDGVKSEQAQADRAALLARTNTSGWGQTLGGTLGSIAGGIGGGIAGAIGGPVGIVAGAVSGSTAGGAGGGAAGESIEQWWSGRGQGEDVAEAAVEEGLWGLLPGVAGATGKAGLKVVGKSLGGVSKGLGGVGEVVANTLGRTGNVKGAAAVGVGTEIIKKGGLTGWLSGKGATMANQMATFSDDALNNIYNKVGKKVNLSDGGVATVPFNRFKEFVKDPNSFETYLSATLKREGDKLAKQGMTKAQIKEALKPSEEALRAPMRAFFKAAEKKGLSIDAQGRVKWSTIALGGAKGRETLQEGFRNEDKDANTNRGEAWGNPQKALGNHWSKHKANILKRKKGVEVEITVYNSDTRKLEKQVWTNKGKGKIDRIK